MLDEARKRARALFLRMGGKAHLVDEAERKAKRKQEVQEESKRLGEEYAKTGGLPGKAPGPVEAIGMAELPEPRFKGYVIGDLMTKARMDAFERRDFDHYHHLRSEEDFLLLGQTPRDPVNPAVIVQVEARYEGIRLEGCRTEVERKPR